MTPSFSSEPASRRQRLIVAVIAVTLCAAALAGFIHADVKLADIPAFLPFYGGVIFLTDLTTAFLLTAQFRISRRPAVLALAAAYFYSGLIVAPQLLVFPGVVTPTGLFGAGSQSAIWLWVLWHGGFPALILVYCAVTRLAAARTVPARTVDPCHVVVLVTVAALVTSLVVLVTAGHDWLPVLVSKGSFTRLSSSVVGGSVIGLNILALVFVSTIIRPGTIGQLGLLLAVLASLLDAVLTLHSGARFTLGWYLARINSIVSAGSVLAVFLFEIAWLFHRVAALNDGLSRLALLDDLTGLANRRQFNERLTVEWARAIRETSCLGLIMVDVDFFKRFNDRYGHPAGDACLRAVGQALMATAKRPGDLPARYGGEEFAVILPDTSPEGVRIVAERIAEAIRRLAIRHEDGTELGVVTVSLGMAVCRPGDLPAPEHLVARADAALYRAKEAGRNRVSFAEPAAA